jgi:autotransporter-associated beta strand protein
MKKTAYSIAPIFSLIALLAAPSAFAASTDTWVGNQVDANFSTTANWTYSSGSGPVASGDSLVFGAAGSAGTTLNEDQAGLVFNAITFGATASAYTIGGNGFTLGTSTAANVISNTIGGGNQIINNNITLGNNGQTITNGGTTSLTLAGNISGAGTAAGLTKAGTGTLSLSGANNTYAGPTVVNGGALTRSDAGGSPASTATVTVGATASATMKILAGANVTNFNLAIGGGASGKGAVYQSGGTFTLSATATANTAEAFVIGGPITAATPAGAYGYYNLSGGAMNANALAMHQANNGGTRGYDVADITGGTLTITNYIRITRSGNGGWNDNSAFNVLGGTVTAQQVIQGNSFQICSLTVGGGGGAASVATTGSTTLGYEMIESSGNSGINNNSPNVGSLLANGTLTVGKVNATATSRNAGTFFNFNGGTLKAASVNAGANFFNSANITAVSVYSGGGTIDNNGTAITIGKVLAAPAGSGVTGGTLTAGSGYIGAPFVEITGGTANNSGDNRATAIAIMADDGTGNGTYKVSSILITSPGSYSSVSGLAATFNGGAPTAAATFTALTTAANTGGGMTFQGSGTTTLTAANSYSGGTTLSAGGLTLSGSGTLGAGGTAPLTVNAGTLDLGALTTPTAGTVTISGGTIQNGTLTASTAYTVNNSGPATVSAKLAGPVALTKSGSGTLTLSGINTYSDITTISAGTLTIGGGGQLGSGSYSANISDDGTFNYTSSAAQTLSGVISGAGALIQNAVGTLTLSGANGYGGTTTVSAGKLVVSSAQTGTGAASVADGAKLGVTVSGASQLSPSSLTLGSSTGATLEFNGIASTSIAPLNPAAVTVGGTTTVNINSGTTAVGSSYPLVANAGSLSGYSLGVQPIGYSGHLSVVGGTLTYTVDSQADTWTGASANWDINNSVSWGGNALNNSPSGTYAQGDSVLFDDTASGTKSLTVAAQVNPASIGVVNTATYSITSGGGNYIGGSAGLIKTGSGSLTLAGGVNTYSGVNTINGGTVSVGALANGGSPSDIGSSANFAANLSLNGGALQYTGAGSTSDRLFAVGTAGATVDASGSGALNLNNTGSVGLSGAGTRALTLTGANTAANTLAAVVGDNGGATSLTKSGVGAWTLLAANGYSGGTTLSAGQLNINTSSTLGTGALTIGGGTIDNISSGDLALAANNVQNWNGDFAYAGSLHNLNLGSGGVTLGASRQVTVSANTLTVGGSISGVGFGLTKLGAGTLALSGANGYTGGTTVSAGQLTLGSTTAIGTGTLTMNGGNLDSSVANLVNANNNAQAWNSDFTFVGSQSLSLGTGAVTPNANRQVTVSANTLTVGGVIAGGAISLTKAGNGNLTLSAINTFTGGATVNGATLTLNNGGGSGVVRGTLTINSGATVILASGDALGFNTGGVSASPINIVGGTLTNNSGNEGFVSTFNLTGGTMSSSGGFYNCSGASAAINSLASSTLSTISGGIDLRAGGMTITTAQGTVPSGIDLSISGVIKDTGPFTKAGTGTLALSGVNTYSGGTTNSAGTLTLGSTTAISTGTLTMNGGNLDSAVANLVNANNNPQAWNSDLTFVGSQNLNLGTGAVTPNANRQVTVSANTLTVGGVIAGGAINLTKAGAGTLTLSGINTFSGTTTISAGTLTIGGAGGLGSGSYSANITDNGTFNYNSSAAQTLSGVISGGSGALIQNAVGTLTLCGANSYGGTTTVSAGKLVVSSAQTGTGAASVADGAVLGVTVSGASQLSPASLTLGSSTGATLELNGIASTSVAPLNPAAVTVNGTATVNINSGTVAVGSSYPLLANAGSLSSYSLGVQPIGYSGHLSVPGGVLTYTVDSQSDIWTGASANWDINSSVSWAGKALNNAPVGTYTDNDSVLFDDTASGTKSVTVAAQVNPAFMGVVNPAAYSITSSGGNYIGGSGALIKSGSGSLTVSGPNTYSGGTTLSAGQLNINDGGSSSANSAIGTGTLTISGGTIDNTSTADVTLQPVIAENWNGDITYAGSVHNLNLGSGAVTLGASRQVTVSANTLTVGGAISGAGFGLTKVGAGTLALSGANTYNGPTTISAGAIQLGNANALQNSTVTIGVANALTFATSIGTFSVGALSGSVNEALVDTGSSAVTLSEGGNNAPTSYSGILSGAGGLTKVGNGTLTLSGNQTYTGGTTVSGGTLALATGGGTGAIRGALNINSAAIVNCTAGDALGYTSTALSATPINIVGGTLTGTGNQGFVSVFNLTGGTMSAAAYQFDGANGAAINSLASSTVSTISGSISLRSSPVVISTAQGTVSSNVDLTISGVINNNNGGGASTLVKSGAGTLMLSGANTYPGDTTVGNGRLLVNGTVPGAVDVMSGAVLGGNGTIGGAVTVEAGGTLATGASIGTLTLNSSPVLGGLVVAEIDRNGGSPLADLIAVVGNPVSYGGSLVVSNLGAALQAGDAFTLFTATAHSGSFAGIVGSPGSGLHYSFANGVLSVLSNVATNPTNITSSVSGNQLTLSWPSDHTGWRLQAQTNSIDAGLGSNWTDVAGATTTNQVTITINPANGTVFFRLLYP